MPAKGSSSQNEPQTPLGLRLALSIVNVGRALCIGICTLENALTEWEKLMKKINISGRLSLPWPSVVLFLGLGIGFYIAYISIVPAEDADILFNYSRNLATRGVITYGAETSVPVEGATDFLYLILITLASKVGFNEFASALILNYLGILLICYLFWRISASTVLPLVAVVATPFLYAAIMGFSAILFSALYLLCLHLSAQKDRRVYLAILGLCLLRPDGVVWSAGIVGSRLAETERSQLSLEIRYLVLSLIIPGLVYFAWRLWYFGEWLPLPFIVKSSGERKFTETAGYLLPILVPTVTTILCAKDKLLLMRRIVLLFALPVVFFSCIRLEQNIGDRFLAPMFFGVLMLLVSLNLRELAAIFLVMSVCLTWQLTFGTFYAIGYTKDATARPIGLQLRKLPPGKLLSSEAGMLAYYSGWAAEDSWGLNTPRYAHRLITESDVAQGAYDLIMVHCDINLLGPEAQPVRTVPTTRTWTHHCEALAPFLYSSGYKIYLVPTFGADFLDPTLTSPWITCIPQTIYAVSPGYSAAPKVQSILRSFGALAYDRSAEIYLGDEGDELCRANKNPNRLSSLHPIMDDFAARDGTRNNLKEGAVTFNSNGTVSGSGG